MERRDLKRSSYNLFRTRLEIPGYDYYWDVTTVDIRKLKESSRKLDQFFTDLTCHESDPTPSQKSLSKEMIKDQNDPPYETYVCRKRGPTQSQRIDPSLREEFSPPYRPLPIGPFGVAFDEESGADFIESNEESEQVYFLRAYASLEEARFGHEELVFNILNGRFFYPESPIAEYMLYPDFGEDWYIDEGFNLVKKAFDADE